MLPYLVVSFTFLSWRRPMKASKRLFALACLSTLTAALTVGSVSATPSSGLAPEQAATAAATADMSATGSASSGTVPVGFVLVGPKQDKGWSQAHYDASQYLQSKIPSVNPLIVEALDPNVTLDQIVQNLKGQGAKLIFTTSDFFQDDTTAAAKKYPDITFINASGDAVHKGTAPANLGNVMGRAEYMKMLGGCAAALATQTKSIAYMGPLINDETRRLANSVYR